MMYARRALFLFLALSVMGSRTDAQVVPDTTVRDTLRPRPFVEGGVYDKPYLAHLMGRTAIGGYAEAHVRWAQADGVREELGFELRRWNLFTATQVNDFVRIAAEVEVEELAEEITLEFAAIDVAIHPLLTLRAGALLSPLGRFNLAHDSPRNEFTDRPLVSTEIIGTALTEPGAGLLGALELGGAGRITWEAYAVNGFHEGVIASAPEGTRIPAGKKNIRDENASPAFVGRLSWSPGLQYEIGLSGHRGAYNVYQLDGERVDRRRDVRITALDASAAVAGIEFSGEALLAGVDVPEGMQDVYASRQRGLYGQAVHRFGAGWVRTMPSSFFEAGVRYDGVDFDSELDGDSVQRLTLGLNFRPSEDVALKFNLFRGRVRDRFNNAGEQAGMLFSIASYF
ncbi:MAG: hypothetical protein ACRELT_16450 [Longimicrobiales bacterium]